MSFADFFRTGERGVFGRFRRRKKRDPESVDKPTIWTRTILPSFMLLLVFGVCVANVMYRPGRAAINLVAGQRAPFNDYADTDFEYADPDATDIERDHAANRVHDVFRINTESNVETKARILQLLSAISGSVEEPTTVPTPDDTPLNVAAASDQETRDCLALLFQSEDHRHFFSKSIEGIIARGIIAESARPDTNRQIRVIDELDRNVVASTDELATPKDAAANALLALAERFPRTDLPADQMAHIREDLLPNLIVANLEYDATVTNEAREQAREAVATVMRQVEKNTLFLKKDTIVSNQDLIRIKAHETAVAAARDSKLAWMRAFSLVWLTTLGIGVCALVMLFGGRRHLPPSQTVMVAVSIMIAILLSRGMEELLLAFFNLSTVVVYPALPIALAAVLVTLLWDARVGMLAGLLTAFLVSQRLDESMHVFIGGLAASVAAAASVGNVRTRTQTFRAAAAITVAIFAVESAFLLRAMTPWQTYLTVLGVAAANGIGTVILINLLQPIFEGVFRVTTNINLLELSDLNHPLLKRLQMEAPGTYHHTLMVATLAEQAAEAIGANPLLCRVAAYFHDIGKLSNPSYFTENAFGMDRHADLSPRMSALIILNHVKEGLVLAQKYKLRKPLREVIASHHGTSRIYFFYRRAVDEAGGDESAVDEFDYRYPGPLPRSKEAAIISLADSCEAASRSLQKPSPQKIDALISDIFRDRILDGQLADCELTLREIEQVQESIKQSLRTMLHGRIAYPPNVEHENRTDKKNPKPQTEPPPSPDENPKDGGPGDEPGSKGAAA